MLTSSMLREGLACKALADSPRPVLPCTAAVRAGEAPGRAYFFPNGAPSVLRTRLVAETGQSGSSRIASQAPPVEREGSLTLFLLSICLVLGQHPLSTSDTLPMKTRCLRRKMGRWSAGGTPLLLLDNGASELVIQRTNAADAAERRQLERRCCV